MKRSRPRPVLIYGCVMAGLSALITYADITNLVREDVLNWIRLFTTILGAVGGAVWAQSRVTPLSDPRDDQGRELAPVPETGPRVIR